ncbi:MAG TPA: riboflavin biosynthesis protein RibF [Deltaproteobacteria bacterium]|nr:riboflavin biosynthesis protein RibF [Deltaproteobacteria bacterium]HQB38389.1 riboflavin biosynthesis protein RibF [Deltaproteobacteria bacterium]
MRIYSNPEIDDLHLDGSVVTIGNFDGVHRGHAEIFRRLNQRAHVLGLPSVVITFEPHPLKLLAPEKAPLLITRLEQKARLIADCGVDCLVVIDFTHEFSMVEAGAFVRNQLCKKFGMRHIIIGHDYAFGRGRQGNYATLAGLGGKMGFGIEAIAPVGEGDTTFSSTMVRRMVLAGDVISVPSILGRYHVTAGRVVHGREIGRMLGFPTANISTLNELVPCDGVYAVMVAVGEEFFRGACSVGTSPSMGSSQRTIEVFLLDFSAELYDRELALCFVKRLRDIHRYPDPASLVEAIGRDVEEVRLILDQVEPRLLKPLFTCRRSGALQ